MFTPLSPQVYIYETIPGVRPCNAGSSLQFRRDEKKRRPPKECASTCRKFINKLFWKRKVEEFFSIIPGFQLDEQRFSLFSYDFLSISASHLGYVFRAFYDRMKCIPVSWIWIDLNCVEEEVDTLELAFRRCQVKRGSTVVIGNVQVDVAQPGSFNV